MSPQASLERLLAAAKKAGAEAADAVYAARIALTASIRLGRTEHVERAESLELGLRVFVGGRSAVVSVENPAALEAEALAERAVAMARVLPPDPHGGLAAPPPPLITVEALDLCDPFIPSAELLAARAAAAEAAALAVPGVRNSEGAEASWGRSEFHLLTSNGFAGTYARTSSGLAVTAVAGEGTAMERDYEAASALHAADLPPPETLGRRAGERAVRRLNPRRPATTRLPVVYEPRVAAGLIGHLAAAINGASLARGTSFLKGMRGERLFPQGVHVWDDPWRRRGPRSRPFDAEGYPTRPLLLVADGVLREYLLDQRSARQLGLAPTGHAVRAAGGQPAPAPSNLYLAPGRETPEALIGAISEGLYVTELIGMGVNAVTGDYSRGAAGFMIRQGKLAEPVAEITIAGNLREMFATLTPANDLEFRFGTDAPTVRIAAMTMAGQ